MRSLPLLLALCLATSAHADEFDLTPTPTAEAQSPWYLPRSISLFTYVGAAVTPQLRLSWEVPIIKERADALILIAELGGGWAMSTPSTADANGNPPLSSLYLHTAQFGVGYRETDQNGLYWGLQVTTGPLFYGAKAPGMPVSHDTLGGVEGRLGFGYWVGKVAIGAQCGWMQLVDDPIKDYGAPYAGGFLLGGFVHWW